jgi:SAM-dependent methyltransferase
VKVRESGMPDQAYWESLIDHCGLLEEMDLNTCASVFEFGVGYGSFLACFKGAGTVVAGIDIDETMVLTARQRLDRLGMASTIQHGDFFDIALLESFGKFSACLMMNILHHTDPRELIATAARLLTPGGRIGMCHWRDDIDTPRGPPLAMRIGLDAARRLAASEGLAVLKSGNSARSPYHYYVVAGAETT